MMNPNERIAYERKIIASILQTENNFADVISFGLSKDIFISQLCKDAFDAALKYVFEFNKFPNHVDLYSFLIPTKNKELKDFILHLGTSSYELQVMPFVKHLLDQNVSNELNEISKLIQTSDNFGLDLAHDIHERITKIIYKYFQKYVMDKSLDQSVDELITNIKESKSGKAHQYIPTGLKNLDKYIIGFHKHSVAVIGARPGIGKTAFMQQCNRNILAQGYKTGIISIEMDAESLLIRDVSANCMIDSVLIESGNLGEVEMQLIENATDALRSIKCSIDEDSYQTPQKIMATINKWKIQHSVDIIFIDYLQLIKPEETREKQNTRYDLVIGKTMEEFRKFTKATGTPIVLLSQLNRNNEARQDKMPQLSDLRESGAIEQDARQVLFLHSPNQYGINPFADSKQPELICDDGSLLTKEEYFMILIAKNRGGLTGYSTLRYMKPFHTFQDVCYKEKEFIKIPAQSFFEPIEQNSEEDEFPI